MALVRDQLVMFLRQSPCRIWSVLQ